MSESKYIFKYSDALLKYNSSSAKQSVVIHLLIHGGEGNTSVYRVYWKCTKKTTNSWKWW